MMFSDYQFKHYNYRLILYVLQQSSDIIDLFLILAKEPGKEYNQANFNKF